MSLSRDRDTKFFGKWFVVSDNPFVIKVVKSEIAVGGFVV